MKKLLLIGLLIVGCVFGREFDLEIQQTINFRTQDIYQDINVFDENKFRVEVEIEIADTIYNQEYEDDYVKYLETEKYIGYFAEPIKNSPVILMIRFQFNVLINKQYVTLEETEKVKKKLKRFIQNNGWGWDTENVWFSYVDFESLEKKNDETEISTSLLLNRDDIYDDSWAVIIGIDNYQNLSNLDYAVADAEAVKKMLITKFDYSEENVKLLLNEDANKANIVNVISDVSLKAGENDRILVFYAGHGETMPLPEGGEMGYLVPIDGNQDNLFASAIPMDDLKDLSNMSKAKHMLFLIDACYGGLAAVGSRGLEPAKTPNYLEKISKIKSRQIITAGGKDEKVFEKSEWGHSAYTKNLLRALKEGLADTNKDGYITADELGDFLSEKVSIDSENQQTPQSRRLTSHEGEFVFVYSENTVINQNVGDKSTDAKLDLLLSKIEKLESQSIANEKLTYSEDKTRIHEHEQIEEHVKGESIYGLNIFSDSKKLIRNKQVKGGLFVTIFGDSKLSLVKADLNKRKNIINIINIFGDFDIIVPTDMYVETKVLPIFGDFFNRSELIKEDNAHSNKKLIIRGLVIFGSGSISSERKIYKSTAYFKIGMTEEEFIRKNPSITEKNDDDEFPIYIENCKEKYTYKNGTAFPLAHCEEYTFAFNKGTLEAVYRGRNNFNREIDYNQYPNAKP